MNTFKNITTIHFMLNETDVLEVIILLMAHLINEVCISNKTEDSNLSVFNMVTGIN